VLDPDAPAGEVTTFRDPRESAEPIEREQAAREQAPAT
jgi:hypothetical protein